MNSFLFTHTYTHIVAYPFVLCVYVFMHLVAVPNKAGRLTGHIASNQKTDREKERVKGGRIWL